MRRHHRRGAGLLVSLLLTMALLGGLTPTVGAASPAPTVKATGAIVMDFDTDEVYYEKNADVPRPIASMTKVMSLYLVFEEIAAGNLSPESYVTASPYAAGISNDPLYSGLERLRAGEQYQVDTLIRLIVTESCNGSVIVLAEHLGDGDESVFVQRMNDKAAAWGIEAHFADACGFEDHGNSVTPRAMAYIAKRIIADYPQILEYTSLQSMVFQGKTFYSTNTLLRNGSCEGIDGLKTGTTDGAGYCFTGTAQRNGRRIISVVMNTTGYSARMSESRALLEYGFSCRAEREEQWTKAAQSLEADITAQNPLWSRTQAGLSAVVTGLEGDIFGAPGWEVDGIPQAPSEPRWVKNGDRLELPLVVPVGEEPLTAALVLTLPDGSQLRREAELSRPEEDLGFVGRLGLQRAEMYSEAALTVPFRISTVGPVCTEMCAGWYLDGLPIPEYQNSAFRVGPEIRMSSYTLRGEELAPGWHTLEFRCNTEGLPGIAQESFSMEILRLDDEAPSAAPGTILEKQSAA